MQQADLERSWLESQLAALLRNIRSSPDYKCTIICGEAEASIRRRRCGAGRMRW